MELQPIPEDIRRFILANIHSVPYLEALLLLRAESDKHWTPISVAQRLYTSEKIAEELLRDLCAAGAVVVQPQETGAPIFRFHPQSDELRQKIDQLAEVYVRNLVQVANLIHSKIDRKAQHFADAFKWRKDS